jgi:hypothetical protein
MSEQHKAVLYVPLVKAGVPIGIKVDGYSTLQQVYLREEYESSLDRSNAALALSAKETQSGVTP